MKIPEFTCDNCGNRYRNVVLPLRCPCGYTSEATKDPIPQSRMITYDEWMKDCMTLSCMLPPVKTVIGVARSGMVPASVIAMHHSADLMSLSETQGLTPLGGGVRWSGYPERDGITVVVEDSCWSGRSLSAALDTVRTTIPDAVSACVYVSPKSKFSPDFSVATYRSHWFEWNLGNTIWSETVAFDIDGVLCPDFTREEDDDGPRYLQRMMTMPAGRIMPRTKPVHLVTARLERYREPTMQWLVSQGVRVAGLHMGPWETKAKRERADIWDWKGQVVGKIDGVHRYVESDDTGARQVARYSGKPCICPSSGKLYLPDAARRGIGDFIADVTHAVGIKQCGKCRNRHKNMNG